MLAAFRSSLLSGWRRHRWFTFTSRHSITGVPHYRPSAPNSSELTVFLLSNDVDEWPASSSSTHIVVPLSTQPVVYINDLEEGVTGKILKFADDTKLFRKVKEIGDKQNVQDDIDKLVKWSDKWQMLFNFGKCKCLHTGSINTGMNYEMGGTILSKTVKEKDLGVTMNANMKVSEQCRIAASKGNQVLGMIRRKITYKEKSLIIPLYKAIVRPHLEYCIQAWNPHLRKDVDMLEKIQRRATKLIPERRDLTYEERLKECGLTTLETRRLRGDQIEVFNILNGYENIDSNIFFEIKESKITRGHNYTLVKKQSRLDVRKYSFSQRTINVWNNLSTDCVHASSVNMFKNKIDKYLVKAGYN